MVDDQRDAFICHAGEDKEAVARPLAAAFEAAGISVWFDEAEIEWGDNIPEKIDKGLRISRYVIAIISPAFATKEWPQKEMRAALSEENSDGVTRVLPLMVGVDHQVSDLLRHFPLLKPKRYKRWNGEPRAVVDEMLSRLKRRRASEPQAPIVPAAFAATRRIPMPRIAKRFTQRDRDEFLEDSFRTVEAYFETALRELSGRYAELETKLTRDASHDFRCRIYRYGDLSNECRLWIGGWGGEDQILYRNGRSVMRSDNSYNASFSVQDDGHSLGFPSSGFLMSHSADRDERLLSAEDLAERLWLWFIEDLEQGEARR